MNTSISFKKYHGTGNDFILIDNREQQFDAFATTEFIRQLCDRHLGIGADGLMLLQHNPDHDFEMRYFNSDGRPGSMCGNGGRCIVAFARLLGLPLKRGEFLASDGPHAFRLLSDNWVELQLQDVSSLHLSAAYTILNTGSPHLICFTQDLDSLDIVFAGRQIRYRDPFTEEGINVNFVRESENGLTVYTYERGVEDETLSCGTGVTAAAIAFAHKHGRQGPQLIPITTKGGRLEVKFIARQGRFEDIWLSGPAVLVYDGAYYL
jgi:diaminopimelate epimerase